MALQHIKYFIKTNTFPYIAVFHNQILSWHRAALALVCAGSALPSFAFPVDSAEEALVHTKTKLPSSQSEGCL